ncbi:MAG TPA: sigma-70 family RNA polymerase sigma factor [Streptosporangiaceae bacterium]|nr:sigma-70 family RNA polymerase sigma factor [Streptosporangiaceae bacterium]
MEQGETRKLVEAAAEGDEAAWRAIVERFSGLVWAVARGFRLGQSDAGDVYQTVWLRLAENLRRIQNPDQLGAWLATTARRESLRMVRGRRRDVPIEDAALTELLPVDESSPEFAALEAEQARLAAHRAKQMWRAFRELPGRCQQLLRILMATHRPSYAEAAAALDVPVGSIGPTRARCLNQLRRRIGEVSEAGSQPHTKKRDNQEDGRAGRA